MNKALQRRAASDPHRHHARRLEAIAASLPLGSVGYEPQLDRQGQHPGYRDREHTVKRNGGEVLDGL